MELLAPAGNWEAFQAAINNGADAVYVGGERYSARQSAENFNTEKLKQALDYAHLSERKVYVAVNTLIDNQEMNGALDYLYDLYHLGVDGVIVQDVGLIHTCKQVLPELPLHGSTQMTIHNAQGVSFWKEQGLKRIVLSRECSEVDMQSIHQQVGDVELEVFVHGALCYSYSGQCLFSSIVGGRSGNRGRCAQPCRLPYDLYSRTKGRMTNAHGKYLLSPADLCLIEYLPELLRAGVSSLKIEGRMKRPEYVAIVTREYREALDELQTNSVYRPDAEVKEKLLKVFNRNFTTGYFIGEKKGFLSSTRPNNRGVHVGRVVEQGADFETKIKLIDTINAGDGLTVWVGKGKNPSTVLGQIKKDNHIVETAQAGETIVIPLDSRVFSQDRVFKTHDEQLIAEAQASIQDQEFGKIPVDIDVNLVCDQPAKFVFKDDRRHEVTVTSKSMVQKARQHPLDEAILRNKLERMGNTPFFLRSLRIKGESDLMLPVSNINEARRKATDELQRLNLAPFSPSLVPEESFKNRKKQISIVPQKVKKHKPILTISVSSLENARLALQNGADRVYLGMEGIGTHRRLTAAELEICARENRREERIIPLMPRIHKPEDRFVYSDLLNAWEGSVMIGSWGDLGWAVNHNMSVEGDYNLNVFNQFSLQYLQRLGMKSICLSPELNFGQLQTFRNFDKVELLVHGELILMESQYCMLGAVLGQEKSDCGTPCRKDQYFLQDEKAYQFPVETDADCRFYVFNSRTLCLIEDLSRLIAMGAKRIRIEARRANANEIVKTVRIYRETLDLLWAGKKADLKAYHHELESISESAFTKCHYYRGVL
ncbi:MAG: U32 family peptidase [Bacillota bacterium]|nr:U32 family peptidase [Bacillota bacterium]